MDRKGEGEREVRAARSTLATRLPVDFGLTPERRAIAEAEKADPEREFAQFTDHFRAAPGVKGRKNDWDATWRNWCRRAPDFKPHVNGTAASHSSLLQQPQNSKPGRPHVETGERLAFETILGEMFAAIDKPLGDAKIEAFGRDCSGCRSSTWHEFAMRCWFARDNRAPENLQRFGHLGN